MALKARLKRAIGRWQRDIAGLYAPPGHYSSPIVDRGEAVRVVPRQRTATPEDLPGIDLELRDIVGYWNDHLAANVADAGFPTEKQPGRHYYTNNGGFGIADAAVLRAMLLHVRPARYIEVGCGFSTACLLDVVAEAGLTTEITCIDPFPKFLNSALGSNSGSPAPDRGRLRIIQKPVQQVPIAEFERLQAGDILFLDTTHIMKTGSDVHFELTKVLPALARGVIVHFHDIFYPFEYPYIWAVTQGRSWNEAYALHAFLMYNSAFKVIEFNDMLALLAPDLAEKAVPGHGDHFGGSIWLEKVG